MYIYIYIDIYICINAYIYKCIYIYMISYIYLYASRIPPRPLAAYRPGGLLVLS